MVVEGGCGHPLRCGTPNSSSSQAHRLGWKTGAQQLTLFVSRYTAQGLRTGKLYQSRDADIDGLETNFFSGAETGGTEEPCYEINPFIFRVVDENCGHIRFDIVDVKMPLRKSQWESLWRGLSAKLSATYDPLLVATLASGSKVSRSVAPSSTF